MSKNNNNDVLKNDSNYYGSDKLWNNGYDPSEYRPTGFGTYSRGCGPCSDIYIDPDGTVHSNM